MTEAIRQGDIPGVQLRCRQAVDRPVERVWEFLVESERVERWLCHRVRSEAEATQWCDAPDLPDDSVELVRPIANERPRRFVASLAQPGWSAATRLEIELLPADEGCEVSVLQNGFEHLPLSDSLTVWETYRRRWRAALVRLAEVARAAG